MRKPYPSEQQDRFIVRLPDGMRDRIAEAARANNRSMNAEVVSRLEASFERIVDSEGLLKMVDHRLEQLVKLHLGPLVEELNELNELDKKRR